MSRIRIVNLFDRTLDITDHSRPLLTHFHDHGIDWMHACGAKGRCTTCRFIIVGGGANLEPPTQAEIRYLTNGGLREGERLACQARITGDVTISIPDDTKLPHMKYSDD